MKHGRARWLVDQRRIGRGRHYFESRSDAEMAIEDLTREFENRHAQALNITAIEAASFLAQKERLKDVGTIEQAVDYFLAHYRPVEAVTVAKAVEACLKAKEAAGRKARTIKSLRSSLESFVRLFGERQVSAITRPDIEQWLVNPAWKAVATRRGKFIDVQTFFSFVVRAGWRKDSPTATLEKITVDGNAPKILTPEQCKVLMDAALFHAPEMVPYFALSIFCGLRNSEIRGIGWQHVQTDRGFVEIPREIAKNRKRRLISIRDNCKAWLALGGEIPPTNWRKEFDYVRRQAKLYACWSKDVMRHSFVSYHYASHGPAETAKQAGHSEQILFKHYRELVTEQQAKEFWEIWPINPTHHGLP